MIVLVPTDVLRPRRVDEHFAAEADAARAAGIEIALVDHDALTRPDGAQHAVSRVSGAGEALYRGWMLRSEQYAAFDHALRRRGVTLRTTAAQYRQAHELPGWYPTLAPVTPVSVWTDVPDRAAFDRARTKTGCRTRGAAGLHQVDEALLARSGVHPRGRRRGAVLGRGMPLSGVARAGHGGRFRVTCFERFVSAEVRTWWVAGVCRLIGPHPDTAEDRPDTDVDLSAVAPLVADLHLPFVTVDLALREDGVWRVIEMGDGQVSDRPRTMDAAEFIHQLVR